MTSVPYSRPVPQAPPRQPLLDALFGSPWPDSSTPARPGLVAAALTVGVVAAVVVPFREPGLGTFLVFSGVAGVVAVADGRLRSVEHASALALSLLLGSVVVLRDAQWIAVLCALAALAVAAPVLAGGRSTVGLVLSWLAVPLAGLRGLPWLGRSAVAGRGAGTWPLARTLAISALLLTVFAALFSSADALFARWLDLATPDVHVGDLPLRLVVALVVAGATLMFAYLGLNPPRLADVAAPGQQVRRFEWLVPVGVVVAVFAAFVSAQLTAMFGGHDYVRRTTGLTYAEYVHQGFGQMCVATVLTLLVVGVAATVAPRATASDRALLRGVLGALCVLALVVVASALGRMHVYEEAYGFTRLRVLVSVFEAWLGLVLVLVLVAGVRLRGWWLPRAALLTGATALLALALANPDAYIAEQNLERLEQTGHVDWSYLAGLSSDAVPVLATLPEPQRACVVAPLTERGDWLEWNLGRARASDAGLRTTGYSTCSSAD